MREVMREQMKSERFRATIDLGDLVWGIWPHLGPRK